MSYVGMRALMNLTYGWHTPFSVLIMWQFKKQFLSGNLAYAIHKICCYCSHEQQLSHLFNMSHKCSIYRPWRYTYISLYHYTTIIILFLACPCSFSAFISLFTLSQKVIYSPTSTSLNLRTFSLGIVPLLWNGASPRAAIIRHHLELQEKYKDSRWRVQMCVATLRYVMVLQRCWRCVNIWKQHRQVSD